MNLQNKKILILGGIVLLAMLAVGGYFMFFSSGTGGSDQTEEEKEILSLDPEEIGLTLEMGEDGKRVIMRIDNVEDITAIEYQLLYTSEGDVPRGVIGDIEVTGEPIEKELVLGTCSDVCHYDEDVSDIKVILKVTKSDGNIYQAEKALDE